MVGIAPRPSEAGDILHAWEVAWEAKRRNSSLNEMREAHFGTLGDKKLMWWEAAGWTLELTRTCVFVHQASRRRRVQKKTEAVDETTTLERLVMCCALKRDDRAHGLTGF